MQPIGLDDLASLKDRDNATSYLLNSFPLRLVKRTAGPVIAGSIRRKDAFSPIKIPKVHFVSYSCKLLELCGWFFCMG